MLIKGLNYLYSVHSRNSTSLRRCLMVNDLQTLKVQASIHRSRRCRQLSLRGLWAKNNWCKPAFDLVSIQSTTRINLAEGQHSTDARGNEVCLHNLIRPTLATHPCHARHSPFHVTTHHSVGLGHFPHGVFLSGTFSLTTTTAKPSG